MPTSKTTNIYGKSKASGRKKAQAKTPKFCSTLEKNTKQIWA
jgi:hypothetical protein